MAGALRHGKFKCEAWRRMSEGKTRKTKTTEETTTNTDPFIERRSEKPS